jgi:hypothetical protein
MIVGPEIICTGSVIGMRANVAIRVTFCNSGVTINYIESVELPDS